ncbi:hypothetical protein [Formosimonas limnophila]|uniref:hypothetical protein n=1 Tax=Formosimonas limnophila TaxID=1384487 RepID=UPI001677A4C3|nr:hypothetical protein [Formosimonas limnophila]
MKQRDYTVLITVLLIATLQKTHQFDGQLNMQHNAQSKHTSTSLLWHYSRE